MEGFMSMLVPRETLDIASVDMKILRRVKNDNIDQETVLNDMAYRDEDKTLKLLSNHPSYVAVKKLLDQQWTNISKNDLKMLEETSDLIAFRCYRGKKTSRNGDVTIASLSPGVFTMAWYKNGVNDHHVQVKLYKTTFTVSDSKSYGGMTTGDYYITTKKASRFEKRDTIIEETIASSIGGDIASKLMDQFQGDNKECIVM